MTQLFRNEYLFSEIYLQEITQLEEDPTVKATLSTLKEYRDFANTSSLEKWNASFVHEILNALRFGVKKVDGNTALLCELGSDDTITLCYSLLPSEDLNSTIMGQNWSEKIIRNLQNNQLKWGILTNGDRWRIYHTEEPTPYENYLEIDLKGIMDSDNVPQYQIFNKFMKAENFVSNKDRNCQFDVFKKESQDRINYIEKELKNALKQKEEGGKGVLSNICMGYVDYLRKKENPDLSDEGMRDTIYASAMLYMFRLLFLFYARARGLLKESNQELFSDALQAAQKIQQNGKLAKDDYTLWNNLRELFSNIDLTYNGGLFNPTENEFVEEKRLSNIYLAPVIYFMTFYEDENGSQAPISYRDMGVRHLGSLYEGLLEHKLFVAEEDTEVKVTKKEITFIPASKGGKTVLGKYISAGQVYFGTDKGMRKASGSYYTPEYIVDYMVKNTVGKKLDELKDQFNAQNKGTLYSLMTAIGENEKTALNDLLCSTTEKFIIEKVLNLSVIDPAMGSGHFLLNATNLISNFISEFYNSLNIISNTDTSTSYWRRRVVENCIYGIDLNPLAVELAKLSLWILSMSKKRPLSFLDHHLKVGDSLLGAKLSEIGHYPKITGKRTKKSLQLNLFENNQDFKVAVTKAIRKYHDIQNSESENLSDIGDKKHWLDEVGEILEPYQGICDYHTSKYFENNVSEESYKKTVETFSSEFMWDEKKFFHWEIAFPEPMLDKKGFDIVIGNPPYVKARENKDPKLRKIIGHKYESTHKMWDLYIPFIEKGLKVSNSEGKFSMIIPEAFGIAEYSLKLIDLIEKYYHLYQIDFFPDIFIFEDVGIQNKIIFIQKSSYVSKCSRILHSGEMPCIESLPPSKGKEKYLVKSSQIEINLTDCMSLDEICFVSYGLRLNSDKNDTIFKFKKKDLLSDTKTDKNIKLYTEGKYLERYQIKRELYLEWGTERCPDRLVRPTFPELYSPDKLLLSRQKRIAAFSNKGHVCDNTIIVCIIAKDLDKVINKSIKKYFTNIKKDRNEVEHNSKSFHLKYILALINSKLINYYLKYISKSKIDTYPDDWKKVPIKIIPLDRQMEFVKRVDQIHESINATNVSDIIEEIDTRINEMVYELYNLTSKEIKTVESEFSN